MGLVAAAGLGLVSCSDQGTAEKAGQQVDQAMQEAKEKAAAAEEKAKAEASAAAEKAWPFPPLRRLSHRVPA